MVSVSFMGVVRQSLSEPISLRGLGGTCVPTATRDMHRHQRYDSKHSRYDVYDLLPQQCKFAPSHRALFIPLPRRMPPPNQRVSSGPGIFFQKCVAVPVEE